MKRILQFLFPLCAFGLVLIPPPSDAEPPLMPVAVCDDAHCVLTAKDYQELRAFHLRLLQAAREIQEQNAYLNDANNELRQRITRAAFCQGQKS